LNDRGPELIDAEECVELAEGGEFVGEVVEVGLDVGEDYNSGGWDGF